MIDAARAQGSVRHDIAAGAASGPAGEMVEAKTDAVAAYSTKRSRHPGKGAGYAGIENPLFVRPNTRMLYGDARVSTEALVAQLG